MAKILHFETSGPLCSVSLGIDGSEVALVEDPSPNAHAQRITLIMDEVLTLSKCQLSDIDAIAVSSGPGSYTGLRVGASAAKGICFALNIPLIAVNTLEALADAAYQHVGDKEALYVPMIDARRMEVYTAAYSSGLEEILSPQAKIVDESGYEDLVTNWGKNVIYSGSGVLKCSTLLEGEGAILLPEITNSAAFLIGLAERKHKRQEFEDVAYFKPFYLKSPNITVPKPML